ncbi:MAG TPA: DUF2177 family protein [Bradyrhizobium sp.]|nr:DUF2177 family protein [Bradyrhizobium sp.]
MTYLIGYIAALLSFGVVDALWLRSMGPILYQPTLGDILLTEVRLIPAVAFYLLYPIGLVMFAVLPAVKSNSIVSAATSGLVFGAIAYATYDLTNFATLRNWTLQLTVLDIIYGAAVSGLAASAGTLAIRAVSSA